MALVVYDIPGAFWRASRGVVSAPALARATPATGRAPFVSASGVHQLPTKTSPNGALRVRTWCAPSSDKAAAQQLARFARVGFWCTPTSDKNEPKWGPFASGLGVHQIRTAWHAAGIAHGRRDPWHLGHIGWVWGPILSEIAWASTLASTLASALASARGAWPRHGAPYPRPSMRLSFSRVLGSSRSSSVSLWWLRSSLARATSATMSPTS